jgi:hypothetical protein
MNLTNKTKLYSIHLNIHATCLNSSSNCYLRVSNKLRRLIEHSPRNKINVLEYVNVQQLKYTFIPLSYHRRKNSVTMAPFSETHKRLDHKETADSTTASFMDLPGSGCAFRSVILRQADASFRVILLTNV